MLIIEDDKKYVSKEYLELKLKQSCLSKEEEAIIKAFIEVVFYKSK